MKENIRSINAVLKSITNLKRTRREMSVKNWARLSKVGGVPITKADIKECMSYLTSRGYGRYIPGRRRRFECRFQWAGNIDYIRAALRQEIGNGTEAVTPEPVLGQLILELEDIVAKFKSAICQPNSTSAVTVEPTAGSGVHGEPVSLTPSLHLPNEGCFTARDVHVHNPQLSLVSIQVQLKQMVVNGELEVTDVKSGRVGRPVNLYAWSLAKAA